MTAAGTDVQDTIAGQDKHVFSNPILDIAARFWDDERYNAFKTCYRSMRTIDDIVDNSKAGAGISGADRHLLEALVKDWVDRIVTSTPRNPDQEELVKTMTHFQIPTWPWKRFSESMLYDVHNNGFETMESFLDYAQGAAVAPATIGLHLCGVVRENGRYHPPSFDSKVVASPFALFFYLVHIIRDFQEDQKKGLNYFADNLLEESGVGPAQLRQIAEGGEIGPGFRDLMKKYYSLAEHYRGEAVHMLNHVRSDLAPRYQLSLEVIYDLYLQIFERIDVEHGSFTTAELNPLPLEVRNRIYKNLSSFRSRHRGIECPPPEEMGHWLRVDSP